MKYYSIRMAHKEIIIIDFNLVDKSITVSVLEKPAMTIRDATEEEYNTILKAVAINWLAQNYGRS